MQLIQQKNPWSCNACAFAMALDVSLEKIIEICGHDGSTRVHSSLTDEHNRVGFNIMEMIFVATLVNKTVTPLITSCEIVSGDAGHQVTTIKTLSRGFNWRLQLMNQYPCVMIVPTDKSYMHAITYDPISKRIYDPNGFIYPMRDEYETDEVYMIK